MKKFLFLSLLFTGFLFATAQVDNIAGSMENTTSAYVIQTDTGSPTISTVLSESKAETLVDSLQSVAHVLADPVLKQLFMNAVHQLNNRPTDSTAENWLNWTSALILSIVFLLGWLTKHINWRGLFGCILLMGFMSMQSCASCQFTSDYNANKDDGTITGCVTCKNANKFSDKVKTHIDKYVKFQ